MKGTASILLVAAVLVSSCSSKLPLSENQKVSMSTEAAKHLEEQKATSFPLFFITEDRIEAAATDFEKSEAKEEKEIIEKFALTVEESSLGGVPVYIITPKHIASQYIGAIGFSVHGGGFIMGTGRDRTSLLMAKELGLKIYSVGFSNAPKASFPTSINQCFEVYKVLAEKYSGQKIIAISSSAGGQMMLETQLKAKRENITLPKAQILFCPNTDLSFDGDSGDFNDGRDYLSKKQSVHVVKKYYLRDFDAKDPLVSPVYADYTPDFPASIIITSTRDLMMSGAVRINWKFKEAGIDSELLVAEGLWHGYHWDYEMPESRATFREVKKFIDKQFSK